MKLIQKYRDTIHNICLCHKNIVDGAFYIGTFDKTKSLISFLST